MMNDKALPSHECSGPWCPVFLNLQIHGEFPVAVLQAYQYNVLSEIGAHAQRRAAVLQELLLG